MPDRKWCARSSLRGPIVTLALTSALLISGQVGTPLGAAAASRPVHTATRRNQPSTTPYLTVIIGRAQYSKDSGTHCATPANMMTLDQVVPALAALGVHVTAAVIPARTATSGYLCVKGSKYTSWADLSSLAAADKLTVVSASEDYEYMTTLTTANQFAESCGSLSTLIAHGFHSAWGLFAYPDNYWSSGVETAVVQNCFAFGRTYISPHTVSGTAATNPEATMAAPWLQKTNDVGGGRCNTTGACATEGAKSLGRYLSPLTLQALTNVTPGTWTSIQAYTFVTGTSAPGSSIQWNCNDPTGNLAVDWKSHWTSLFEVYCWNDFLYAMTGISPSVVITDPATVAAAWGRTPTPLVTIASVNPGTLSNTSASTTLTWSAEENGAYSIRSGGVDCTSGTVVAGGNYTTSPNTIAPLIPASSFLPGANGLRVCLTNDAGHTGSASTSVTLEGGPIVTGVSPQFVPLAGAVGITITGTGFTSDATVKVGGVAATSIDVESSGTILATVPTAPSGAGTDDVVVSEAAGASPTSTADQVTYDATPSVSGISPPAGPVTGGTDITITGTGFSLDSTVSVGGLAASIVGPFSSTAITAAVPAAALDVPATDDVVVSDAGGSSPEVTADEFTYEPSVTGLSPSSGSVTGGYDITISGNGFDSDATVAIGGVAAPIDEAFPPTSTSITVTVPEASGDIPTWYDVVVTEDAFASAVTTADQFTYTSP